MTIKQLNELRRLQLEIGLEKKRIEELKDIPCEVPEIVYLSALIKENLERCVCREIEIQQFINSIEDSEMRIIFTERYMKCRSWVQIAFLLGYKDERIPRTKHDRYLRDSKIAA